MAIAATQAQEEFPEDSTLQEEALAEQTRLQQEAVKKQKESHGRIGALTSLIAAVGLTANFINDPDRFSEGKLEKEAQKYAKNKVGKNNTVRQVGNAYISTYDEAKQEYYNNYVKQYRNTAKIFKKTPRETLNASLQKAFNIDDARIENENNLKSIDKQGKNVAQQKSNITPINIKAESIANKRVAPLSKTDNSVPVSSTTASPATTSQPRLTVIQGGQQNALSSSQEAEREKRQKNQRNRPQINNRALRKIFDEQRGAANAPKEVRTAGRVVQRPAQFARQTTRAVGRATQQAGKAASRVAQQAGKAVTQAAAQIGSKLAAAAASNPYFWLAVAIIVGIAILIAIFLVIITTITGSSNEIGGQATTSTGSAQLGPSASGIVGWAQTIDDQVTALPGCIPRNVFEATVTNGTYTVQKRPGTCSGIGYSTFFCTDLVIASYNLAGISNDFSRNARTMALNWPSGVTALSGQSAIQSVSPGDAVFYSCTSSTSSIEHVVIVKSINYNSNGAGTLVTLETNSNVESATQRFRNWTITTGNSSVECGIVVGFFVGHQF